MPDRETIENRRLQRELRAKSLLTLFLNKGNEESGINIVISDTAVLNCARGDKDAK